MVVLICVNFIVVCLSTTNILNKSMNNYNSYLQHEVTAGKMTRLQSIQQHITDSTYGWSDLLHNIASLVAMGHVTRKV